jgi:hypothetical protein
MLIMPRPPPLTGTRLAPRLHYYRRDPVHTCIFNRPDRQGRGVGAGQPVD